MKQTLTLLCLVLSFSGLYAQNVGIGTAAPGAKLTVNGAVASTPQSGNAGATIVIPANVTIFRITDDGASAANAVTATSPVDGQFLTIYNTDAQAATFSGQTIAASGGVMSFQYISSGWRLVSDNQSGGGNYIKNGTSTQASSDFNISNTGTIGTTLTVGTSTTSPTVQGSTAASGTLTLKSTSSGTKAAAGILMTDNIASTSTTTGTAVITGGEGISGNLNVGGSATVAGTAKLTSYPSGLLGTDATGTLTTPRTITGTASQIDVTNGNGVSGNPTVNINTTYTADIKAPNALTGGGNITYTGSAIQWTSRFIIISNGNGAQFATNGYFDINMPTSGTVTGVGGAGNVTASAAGIPMTAWQALYYIIPVGSNNASVAANFRIAQYTAALTVPENWVLIAILNGDDNVMRVANGAVIQSGQTWYAGIGMAQNSGSGNYIQNGTAAQSANFNVTGSGTIGSTVKFSSYTSGLLGTDASGTLTTPRTLGVSGTGMAVTNGNGVSGNPTFNLNYGNSVASASGGAYPVGNFGQFENHGTYTDFNTTPNYWGWNYVQGSTNGPNNISGQWYREITGLGANYPGRGTGSYSLELAYPRFNQNAAGVWMRVNEGGSYTSWTRLDANGNAPVSSSLHPSMDDITGWTTVLGSCVDDGAYTINWGFNMTIDGANYTQGWISSNGVLGFGTGSSTAYFNSALPTSISNDPMLFFHWDDDGSDLIRYVVQGTAPNRNCFIEWQGSEATSCGGGSSRVLAYITLSEGSNVVSVRYLSQGSNGDAQGAGATFGFQYAGGSSARTIPLGYNTKLLDDNATNQHFSIDLQ